MILLKQILSLTEGQEELVNFKAYRKVPWYCFTTESLLFFPISFVGYSDFLVLSASEKMYILSALTLKMVPSEMEGNMTQCKWISFWWYQDLNSGPHTLLGRHSTTCDIYLQLSWHKWIWKSNISYCQKLHTIISVASYWLPWSPLLIIDGEYIINVRRGGSWGIILEAGFHTRHYFSSRTLTGLALLT
jgi:hypothetical protein